MELSLDLSGFAGLEEALRRSPALVDRELRAAVEESLALLQREVVEATPTGAYGLLRRSIIVHEPLRQGSDAWLGVVDVADAHGRFGSVLNYAVAVELGTRPHFPPVAPLIDWVRAKLGVDHNDAPGVALAVARKISHRGTDGAHMFSRTFRAQRAQVQRIFDRAVQRIVQQL